MEQYSDIDSMLSNVKMQIYAAVVANTIIFSHGCALGWVSPALPILLSNSTPLSTGPLTNEELSWTASMSSVGSVVGTFLTGFLSMLYGPKRAMAFLAFPTFTFWLMIYFGDTFYYIIFARFIAGLTGGGFQSGVTLFVADIANPDVRGRLGSIMPLARNTGVLSGFLLGALVEYQYRPFVFFWIPIVYLILLLLLPNTPQFYLRTGKNQEAEKALIFYKGLNGKNEREDFYLKSEFERIKLIEEERRQRPKIQLSDLCNRATVKGMIISILLSWFLQMTGVYTITNYASYFFEKSGSILDVNVSAIVLAIVQIIGGLVSTQMGDTFGRKVTMAISLLGSIIALTTLTVYMFMRHNNYDVSNFLWLPLVSSSFLIFITSAGMMALVNTCAVEHFSPKIRDAGMVWYSLWNNSIAFIGDKFFPISIELIYLHGFLLFLIINCCIGLVFITFMKETKGKSLDSVDSNKSKLPIHTDNKPQRF